MQFESHGDHNIILQVASSSR